MSKRNIRPDTPDVDNPAWTAKDLAQARPVSEVLPQLLGDVRAAALLAPRGRPKAEVTKVRVGMRLPPQVVEPFKAGGSGWQTRIDQVLREFVAQKTAHRLPNSQRCRPGSRFVWRSCWASSDRAASGGPRRILPAQGPEPACHLGRRQSHTSAATRSTVATAAATSSVSQGGKAKLFRPTKVHPPTKAQTA